MPSSLRLSRILSDVAQSFAAFAFALSSRTISIRPSITFAPLPDSAALSSLSPRTPNTMSSKIWTRVSQSPWERVTFFSFAVLMILTASKMWERAIGVFMSSQSES